MINILNISVLCSRVFRSSSCTYYFLAYSIFSIIYSCLACLTQFLRGFSIDWAKNRIGCKLHFYLLFVITFKKKIQTSRIIITIATIISAVYMLPMLVIYNWNETNRLCQLKSNVTIYIYIFSQIFLYYILAPLLMIIFGFLTISNIRRKSMNLIYLTKSMRRRRTERQLTRMLLLQVGIHLILILPFGIIYCIFFLNVIYVILN
ncbi:unnamed protein product [Rotaria sp. Silwood2]|nr:unnamed protein product [Rotaria sp. Silwood2]